MGRLMEDKGYFSKVCLHRLVPVSFPSPVIRVALFLKWGHVRGAYHHKGNLCPAFRQIRRGHRVFPVSAFSQLPSAQNNPYARGAYFGVADFDFVYLIPHI